MEVVALVLALVALGLALLTRAQLAGLSSLAEDAQRTARRSADNVASEVERELGVLRRMLAQVAAGNAPSPDMISEGRLWRDVTPPEGVALLEGGEARVIDVRTAHEVAAGMIPGALHIPVDQLEARQGEVPKDGKPTLVVCAGGGRSAAACEFLSGEGYESLHNLSGGMGSWTGPVEKPGA